MASLSQFVADALLSWIGGTAMPSPPSNLYLALYSVMPAKDGTGGTEVTNVALSGFTRQLFTLGALFTDADTLRTRQGSAALTFGPNTSGATIAGIVGWAVWSVPTGGTSAQIVELDVLRDPTTGNPVTKSVAVGDTLTVPLASLKLKAA